MGLGNPGGKYAHTYHNIGFQTLDRLVSKYSTRKINHDSGELWTVAEGPCDYLGKPGQFMNRSGEVVSEWADQYDWNPQSLLIIYDDFSLNVGSIRIRPGGSAGGHNGLSDILKRMGTNEIPRIRVGIGPVSPGGDPAEFVLSKIISPDRDIFRDIFREFPTIIETIAEDGIKKAMNRWNGVNWDE